MHVGIDCGNGGVGMVERGKGGKTGATVTV